MDMLSDYHRILNIGERHQADDGATPIYAARSNPIGICNDGIDRAGERNGTVCGGRVQPLIHRLPGGADGLFEVRTFCAAPGEVWKMHPPDALRLRHQNCNVVEHDPTLSLEHNPLWTTWESRNRKLIVKIGDCTKPDGSIQCHGRFHGRWEMRPGDVS
jgi:hypothetical protein